MPAAPGTTPRKLSKWSSSRKARRLHDATVVGDTVGDPFKDTSAVALNPVIKFTTLFGLLAVELAVRLTAETGGLLTAALAALFFAISFTFVYRSFYSMRIEAAPQVKKQPAREPDAEIVQLASGGDPIVWRLL
jgi:K(+)-stimulated pyrophosphate-energized sodium pump